MKYKAIIFDVDGTLVYTPPEYRYKLVGEVLKEFGITASEKSIDRFWFEGDRDNIIKTCFSLEPEIFWEVLKKQELSELRRQSTKVYDDVGFISELRQRGYKTGIVTGAPPYVVAINLDFVGKSNFDAVVLASGSNGIKPKPHPQGLEICLSLLGVQRNEAVYIGNADEDIRAAKNAQVFDILLLRGEHKFPDINPSLTVHSLYDLRDLFL